MPRPLSYILSFVCGVLLLPIAAYLYFTFGKPPVATADAPLPFEARIVQIPLEARIHREMPASSPIEGNAEALLAGAHIYQHECAFCHGVPGADSKTANTMFPHAPQLWEKHGHGVVGVSDDPVGESYWKVKNGIRLSGMPAYSSILSETEMWQVTMLVAAADKPLPDNTLKALMP